MPDLGPHAAFILLAYAAAILIVGALVTWIVLDGRVQRRALHALEQRGVTRRSAAQSQSKPGQSKTGIPA